MNEWFIKDLSKLTGVSVQTLHYYDRIGLLKPSLRLINGYRVYSENDLVKLQQIIALKHFGFGLQEISTMNEDVLKNFITQKKILQERNAQLQHVINTLDNVINEYNDYQTVDWKNILTLLENYKMLSEHNYQILLNYEKALKDVLTTKELNQYFHLKNSKFANTDEYKAYTQEWIILSQEAMKYLSEDPLSSIGKTLAKKWINLIDRMYPGEYRDLQKTIWEKGYKTGMIQNEVFPYELVVWISKAIGND